MAPPQQPIKKTKRDNNTLEPDPGKSWFCREQTSEADVPILPVNIHGGVRHIQEALEILKTREREISPFSIVVGAYSVHCAPLPNPLNLKNYSLLVDPDAPSGHHIIQLYSHRRRAYKIDLLIEDCSGYLKGFRCHVRMIPGIGASQQGPGPWRVFRDQFKNIPRFIKKNAKEIAMTSSYTITIEVGGDREFMDFIFQELYTFDVFPIVSSAFKKAVHALIALLCEVRRSNATKYCLLHRIHQRRKASALPPLIDRLKNMWDSLSGAALTAKMDGTLDPKAQLPKWCDIRKADEKQAAEMETPEERKADEQQAADMEVGGRKQVKFTVMEQLIGPQGELLITKLDMKKMRDHVTEDWFWEEAKKAKRPHQFSNPMFVTPLNFVPNWLRGDWTSTVQDSLGFKFGDNQGQPTPAVAAATTAKQAQDFIDAAWYDALEDVVTLFSAGVSLDSTDSQGRTALHMASASGHLSVVEYLIQNGANVNATNLEKNTPLHWACLNGHIEVIKALISAGASVSALNSHEKTPMDEAVIKGKMDVINAISAAVAQAEVDGVTVS